MYSTHALIQHCDIRTLTESSKNRGVSRDQWLQAALDVLDEAGIDGVTIDGLSRQLGVSRSGFYWHFNDRAELQKALLDYWVHELTEVVVNNPKVLALDAKTRLRTTAEMILKYDLARYDLAVRLWARRNKEAARAVRQVNRIRLDFIRNAMIELGFKGNELEMRTMQFVCYHTWERAMFAEISRKKLHNLIEKRIEFLTRK